MCAAGAATILTGLFHPQMVAYLLGLSVVLWAVDRRRARAKEPVAVMASAVGILPTGVPLCSGHGAHIARRCTTRDYFFLYNWEWYHWLGMLAPLAILAWFLARQGAGNDTAVCEAELCDAAIRIACRLWWRW